MSNRDLWIRIGARTEGLMAGLKQAEHGVKKFADEVQKSAAKRQALNDLGGTFMKVGALAVAGSALAIKAAMDWETAWTGVLKTVEGTPGQLEALESSLRNLATQTGFAHAEVAAVAEAAGQLGISTDGIDAFTETMLAMGVSTNLSAEEAATGLARFRNIMGSTESEVLNMGSTIVGLGNNFATTEREILEMSMRLAGAGRQAGLTEADVMGVAAAMSSVGIEAEAGGTAMSLTMKRIGKEVDAGGDKLDDFASIAGMGAAEFSKAWKDDAGSALVAFVAGLDKASASGESVNMILSDLGITGIREADALLRLSGNAEGLADALGMAGDEWEQNTALMAEAQKFYDTTSQKAKQAWAQVTDSAISAGESVLPVVAKLLDGVGAIANVFEKIPAPVSGAMVAISGVGGASLLAVGGLIKLADSVMTTRAALEALEYSGSKTSAAMGKLGKAGLVAGTLLAVAAAGQGAQDGIIKLVSDVDELESNLKSLGKSGEWSGQLKRNFDVAGKSFGQVISDPSFAKLADDGFWARMAKNAGALHFGTSGGMTDLTVMRAQIQTVKDMDLALVNLSRNDPEAAIAAFSEITKSVEDAGGGAKELQKAFPMMAETLRSASVAGGGASDMAEVLTGNLDNLAPAAQATAEAMAEAMKSTWDASMSFIDFSKGIDDSKLSLKAWIDGLAEMAQAQDEWAENLIKAANRGVSEGVLKELEGMGPAGAAMLKQLVDGSDAEIERLNGILDGTTATAGDLAYVLNNFPEAIAEFKVEGADDAISTAVEVAAAYDMTPETVRSVLEALDYASEDIDKVIRLMKKADETTASPEVNIKDNTAGPIATIRARLNTLRGVSVSVGTAWNIPQANGGVLDFYGNGGFAENHVAQIAPAGAWRVWAEEETGGEAYIPLAQSKRDRSLEIWAEVGRRFGVQGFANGGVVGGGIPSSSPSHFSGDLYLDSGEFLGKVHGMATSAAERTLAKQQRFDSSQSSAWR